MKKSPFFALLWAVFLLAGCVSQHKVVVEFSRDLREHFTEFPTIEVDIAAVTEGEASEVKQAGVEKYFAPDSGIREKLQSQTCFFSREDDVSFVLPSRAPVWRTWMEKKPTDILVIASLPHDPAITPQADPRYTLVKLKDSYVIARTIYILVEPKKVIRVSKAALKADSGGESPQEAEQWVEARARRK